MLNLICSHYTRHYVYFTCCIINVEHNNESNAMLFNLENNQLLLCINKMNSTIHTYGSVVVGSCSKKSGCMQGRTTVFPR